LKSDKVVGTVLLGFALLDDALDVPRGLVPHFTILI
jgi:hypothetical protein